MSLVVNWFAGLIHLTGVKRSYELFTLQINQPILGSPLSLRVFTLSFVKHARCIKEIPERRIIMDLGSMSRDLEYEHSMQSFTLQEVITHTNS